MAAQQPTVALGPAFLVGVTGGGLYNSGLDYNSAAVLKDALPDSFSRPGKPDIKILKVIENLPSEYERSQEIIQHMWNGTAALYNKSATADERVEVQLMIHMGMRTSEPNYCFETVARRDGYVHTDNCGALPDPNDYNHGGRFDGCPAELRPDLEIEDAGKKAHAALPEHKMRVSTNAGHNLCEWFFYNSVAEGSKRGAPLNVVFVHVPAGRSSEDLKAGVEVLEAYIGALVEQIEKKLETRHI